MFIDRATIKVTGGDGGNGCISFRREAFIPKGGPDGGDGGNGGAVIIQASVHEQSLEALRYMNHYEAKKGANGQGKGRHGRNSEDIIIKVPPGTVIRDCERGMALLADLDEVGATFLAARGGRGGRGNARFATSTNQAPRRADPGAPGEYRELQLELKIIADVGLVGYPNAGKSSFLTAVTNATPETAPYPFTTLHPNVGIVIRNEYRRFTIADIPGLIEDAHLNAGLGHAFLRHIERTRILLYVLDMSGVEGAPPWQQLKALQHELECYSKGMSQRPSLILANKMDEPESEKNLEELRPTTQIPIFPACAPLNEGLDAVLDALDERIAI